MQSKVGLCYANFSREFREKKKKGKKKREKIKEREKKKRKEKGPLAIKRHCIILSAYGSFSPGYSSS